MSSLNFPGNKNVVYLIVWYYLYGIYYGYEYECVCGGWCCFKNIELVWFDFAIFWLNFLYLFPFQKIFCDCIWDRHLRSIGNGRENYFVIVGRFMIYIWMRFNWSCCRNYLAYYCKSRRCYLCYLPPSWINLFLFFLIYLNYYLQYRLSI